MDWWSSPWLLDFVVASLNCRWFDLTAAGAVLHRWMASSDFVQLEHHWIDNPFAWPAWIIQEQPALKLLDRDSNLNFGPYSFFLVRWCWVNSEQQQPDCSSSFGGNETGLSLGSGSSVHFHGDATGWNPPCWAQQWLLPCSSAKLLQQFYHEICIGQSCQRHSVCIPCYTSPFLFP